MLTMEEQTDLEAGLLTLQDDAGQTKRYVRRSRNAKATETDLVQIGSGIAAVQGYNLDTRNLPAWLTVAVRIAPGLQDGTVPITFNEYPVVHEYEANERAYWIWEKFMGVRLEGGQLDALEIKRLLDITDPQPTRPWTVSEVETELRRWLEDKGEV